MGAFNLTKNIFLATTALKRYWDMTDDILFLGEWCIPNLSQEERIKKYPGSEIVPYPWDNRDEFYGACQYVHETYKYLLPQLAEHLNQIHGVSTDFKYWEIIVGQWLFLYLGIIYDRYCVLKKAVECFTKANLYTCGCSVESMITPYDTLHFLNLSIDDSFNVQLFSQIARFMGIKVINNKVPIADYNKEINNQPPYSIHKRIIKKAYSILMNFVAQKRAETVLIYSGVTPVDSIKLALLSAFRIVTLYGFPEYNNGPNITTSDKRNKVGDFFIPQDKFQELVLHILPTHFPVVYLESFKSLRKHVVDNLAVIAKIVGQYIYSDTYKIWLAECKIKGSRYIGVQHGGYYGHLKYMEDEIFECEISEKYCTWGWENGLTGKTNIVPMPALKLVSLKKINKQRKKYKGKKDIILITTNQPRYLYCMQTHYVGPQWKKYFSWEEQFVNHLSHETRSNLKIRLHQKDHGWGRKDKWQKLYPNVKFDDIKNLKKHFISSRLIIVDYPGTTFLEAMATNIPSIFFWDPVFFEMRQGVNGYFDELVEVGILFYSPLAAAEKVEEIYPASKEWWYQDKIQNVRKRFCYKFARLSDKWVREWKEELLE